MKKKELILLIITLACLVASGFVLSNSRVYDCSQPLIQNDLSSCSAFGGTCAKPHSSQGAKGLWENLNPFDNRSGQK